METDAITRRSRNRNIPNVGISTGEAIPDLRNDGSYYSGGRGNVIRLRDSTDFIDLSSISNRQSRYKEYERLRTIAEIETALTVYANECCVHGSTKISTPFGTFTIKELAQKPKDEEFLVYCYDSFAGDYTLGWAYNPRFVKNDETIKVILENGSSFICTPDHKVLLRTGKWVAAGDLDFGTELMPFHRVSPEGKTNIYPKIFTFKDWWKSEKDFVDEWKFGGKNGKQKKLYAIQRAVKEGLSVEQIAAIHKVDRTNIIHLLSSENASVSLLKSFSERFPDRRRVLNVMNYGYNDVYDISVREHENFATDCCILHNCQIGNNNHVFEINCKNSEVKDELGFLFFHPEMLNMDRRLWGIAKSAFLMGDHFLELVIDPESPKSGILKAVSLPADSMYRIESIKGKLLEFQQSKEGPDYQSLSRVEVTKAQNADIMAATAIRFTPEQIVHFRIGEDNRRDFLPYGVSLVEPARGPAHNLRLLEDSMLVYRLTRSPERRVFYIDVGQLPPFRAEALMERIKDQLKKVKTTNTRGLGMGSSNSVEERTVTPEQTDDFFIPIRPNSNTRVETLPGCENTGAVDDAAYFRNKLFIALNFPKNYMSQEDPQITKMSVSSMNAPFARHVERLQSSLADGLMEIAIRHLNLCGYPQHQFEDLTIKLTPPSYYKDISENEIWEIRFNRAMAVKSSQLFSDLDILTRILKISEDEAKEIVSRATIQKLQDLKLQIMAANPQLMGIAMPGNQPNEMGTAQGGPSGPEMEGNEEQQQQQPEQEEGVPAEETYGKPELPEGKPLPEPERSEVKKYDMEISDASKEVDEEEVDPVELDEI